MSKKDQMKKAIIFFLAALLGGLISVGGYQYFEVEKQPTQTRDSSAEARFTNYKVNKVEVSDFNFKKISKLVRPSVVHIKTTVKTGRERRHPFDLFERFPEMRRGMGSGVIISKNGHIVTNNHVIDKATDIQVTLNNKRKYEAEVVGKDPTTDLAVLKIDADNLQPIQYGNSDKVQVGEWVLAVGNPFNLTSTVTAGIVSAKARNLNLLGGEGKIESFIQTDAAVNPGNSGGALVGIDGKLVGINTAIASQTGQYAGYAFAIPSAMVEKVTNDIIEFGEVKRGYLGVSVSNVNQEIAEKHNLDEIAGAYVRNFMDNSAAKAAGLQKEDIIIKVDSNKIRTVPELQLHVGRHRPGDKVGITLIRDGEKIEKTITLKDEQGRAKIVTTDEPAKDVKNLVGAEMAPLKKQNKQKLGIDFGVKVDDVKGGKFAQVGIPDHFIILKINKEKMYKPEDVYEILKNNKGGVLIEGINPDGSKGYYGFGMN